MRSERLLFALVLPLLAGCEIEEVSIPQTTGRVAMHSVLSATAQSQVVLLERTRSGSVAIIAPPFELPSPFGNDIGVAESGAVVTMTAPDGTVLVAREDIVVSPDGNGRGIYRFQLPGNSLDRLGTYRLSVRTSRNEVLEAETSVPEGAVAATAEQRTFDRENETMVLEWPASLGARSYLVRIETPFGPRIFFTDSTRVRLRGDLRNTDIASLPRVFFPGYPQSVTVSAVDSNFYDWFRSNNDALSGTGLINRVRGGLGVFGSLVRVEFHMLRVVAPQREAVSGIFRFVGSDAERASTPYLSLELYVESHAARDDQADALSGRYVKRPLLGDPGCIECGLLGTTQGNRVDLVFLRDWYASDTAEVFTGEIRGDTIVGRYRGIGGVGRFVKQP